MSDCHPNSPVGTATSTRKSDAGDFYTVALVGPPNSGKTTLFNRLTGLRQKVANFPGVTVEHHIGRAILDTEKEVRIVDLPGVYSLAPRSEDELVTHDILHGLNADVGKPDAVLLILDSTNLNRHLVLGSPILSLGLPTLVVLNMADDLERRGGELEVAMLASQLNCPVALVSASTGAGIEKVKQFLSGATARPAHFAQRVELPILQDVPGRRQWAGRMSSLSGYRAPAPALWTRRIDSVALHPIAGPILFFFVVLVVFQSLFLVAPPIMDAFKEGMRISGNFLGSLLPAGFIRSLLIDGIWTGVGSVLVFLPQILFLFLFIGILEDSGYLARAALIADRTMRYFGLQGKSFIPLLSAYACAVPAIMAARTIENKRDRLATILIAPFMTCSARLPVYALIIAAFIPDTPVLGRFLSLRAVTLLGLYALGFIAALLTARMLKSSILKSERTPFILEMPPYRMPGWRSLFMRLVDRSWIFVRRAGTVILIVVVSIWFLSNLPLENGNPPKIENSIVGKVGQFIEPVIKPLGFNWKIGIGLLTSLAAREVIVGTLGTIYAIENPSEKNPGLQAALQKDLDLGGALALVVFFAFALQCFSTIAIVRRETGSWKWPIVQFTYMLVVAFVSAFLVNKLTHWLT